MSGTPAGDDVRAEIDPLYDLIHLVDRDGGVMVVDFANARELVEQIQALIVKYDMPPKARTRQ